MDRPFRNTKIFVKVISIRKASQVSVYRRKWVGYCLDQAENENRLVSRRFTEIDPMNMTEIENLICTSFSENVALGREEIFGQNLSLAEIISRSQGMYNSVDLMEAFARTANTLKKDLGVQVRLPAFPLDTPISAVLEAFLAQVEPLQTTPEYRTARHASR
jgi:hypothetical protein